MTDRPHPALRPDGFRPSLNGDAAQDRRLVTKLLDLWEGEGFAQIAPIAVDFADTLLARQTEEARARAFRFMDPLSGHMLALLPDVTYGIARLARGELATAPRPLRLAYEGQAIRAAGSATRPARQVGQVGVEIIGFDDQNDDQSNDGDQEPKGTAWHLIKLAIESLRALGLRGLSLTLVDPTLAARLIDRDLPTLSEAEKRELAQALDRKDEGKIHALAAAHAPNLITLMRGQSQGDPVVQKLAHLKQALAKSFTGQDVRLTVEPFEQRGFAFQKGPSFALYARGIDGEVGRGGTYDLEGEACFGFTLYRDTLLTAMKQA